jgi:hypothetical protein
MLPWVVNYRSHPRPSRLLLPSPPTPLFPSPLLSPLLPIRYSHTYTTATPQLLCHQSLTHPFLHDGGCTPLSHFGSHLNRIRQRLAPVFSCTSRDPFCNPFVFKFIPEWVRVYPPAPINLPDRDSSLPAERSSRTSRERSDVPTFRRSIRLCPTAQTSAPSACTHSLCYARSPLGGRHE